MKRAKRRYRGCVKYLHRFDELIMKPLFIYKYEKNMQKKSRDFFDLFMNMGEEIENEFKNDTSSQPSKLKRDQKKLKADKNAEGASDGS